MDFFFFFFFFFPAAPVRLELTSLRPRVIAWLSVVSVSTSLGCAEHQFLLTVRDQGSLTVASATEPVTRALGGEAAPGQWGAPVSDRGVMLGTGNEVAYPRDGDWIVSLDPVRVDATAARLSVAFTVHPGRRDLPLVLSLPREDACELRVRSRPSRALGYAGLTVGALAAAFLPITALAHDAGTRHATPFVAVGAGALVAVGATLVLWPSGAGTLVESGTCGAATEADR